MILLWCLDLLHHQFESIKYCDFPFAVTANLFDLTAVQRGWTVGLTAH